MYIYKSKYNYFRMQFTQINKIYGISEFKKYFVM